MTGSLEEGTQGAAYIALKADAPLIPVTFTGTENKQIFHNIKRLRRTQVSLTIGKPFRLNGAPDHRQAIDDGTNEIMHVLASQLPPAYRGYYGNRDSEMNINDDNQVIKGEEVSPSTYTYNHSAWNKRRKFLRFRSKSLAFTLLVKLDQVDGIENIPAEGPAIFLINHIAFVDPIVVLHVCPRSRSACKSRGI